MHHFSKTNTNPIISAQQLFMQYKQLAENAIDQLSEEELNATTHSEGNSIAIIIKHLHGNMLSRWTNFLHTDGEKEWRNRDNEFEEASILTKVTIMEWWETGWDCVFKTLNQLQEADLLKTVYIRNEAHSVLEAINRQIAHYSYHIGQIVFIGKMIKDKDWNNLSIPKGQSKQFNQSKFQ